MQCLWWAWAPLSLVCMHARHFTQEVPMNFREWEGLPVSPQPLWQAVPENCRSVINVPVSRGPPSGIRLPGQVDLVSKLGSASCWRLAVRRGENLKAPSPTRSRRGHQTVYPGPTNLAHQKQLITTDFPRCHVLRSCEPPLCVTGWALWSTFATLYLNSENSYSLHLRSSSLLCLQIYYPWITALQKLYECI